MTENNQKFSEAELRNTAKNWGWENPTSEILEIARKSLHANRTDSDQLLVDMGVVNEIQKNLWLESKPENTDSLVWFADQDASVVPYVERIQTLKFGHPFYEKLSVLTIHPCMKEAAILRRAEELDAMVMMIEETTPVVVFATFISLMKFSTMGRADRANDAISRVVGTNVLIAAGSRDEISAVLTRVRRSDDSFGSSEAANVWSAASSENQSQPANREVTRLIDHALSEGATDIALMPMRNGEIRVHMRKYGEMIVPRSVAKLMNPDMGGQVIALLQTRSGANPSNTTQRMPTDGQITYRSGTGDTFLRLSFIPLNHLGEIRNLTSVSIRLLPRAEESVQLDMLKMDQEVIEQIRFAMRLSQGLVLVVGPTNSGKSTTVAGAIGQHVNLFGDQRKRLSVEDPIERHLHGVQQYNVPTHVQDEAARFQSILKAFKRHDPDLIWVGEVRDKVTADMCVSSASTGHLVLSTMHANNAVMAFDVLAKTVEPEKRFQLIEATSLIVAQRLIKEVCPVCKVVAAPTEEQRTLFSQYTDRIGEEGVLPDTIANANTIEGNECKNCDGGYVGLLPINEILPFSRVAKDAAMRLVGGENSRGVLADARTLTLLKSGLALLGAHKVDLDAILV